MTRICWGLVRTSSRALAPDERDAVLGDFLETGESAGAALLDLWGLVVRRQVAMWIGWRPWLTLVGLAIPLGLMLSIVSTTTAHHSAIHLWLYLHWGDLASLGTPGFRSDLAQFVALTLAEYITLICWSWTSGFALGCALRGRFHINGALFCLILLFGAAFGGPIYISSYQKYLCAHELIPFPHVPDGNAAVFQGAFYRVLFPLILQASLVAIPSLWGMRRGVLDQGVRVLLRTICWIFTLASLVALFLQIPGSLLLVGAQGSMGLGLIRLLQLMVWWPVVYLMVRAIRRRRRSVLDLV